MNTSHTMFIGGPRPAFAGSWIYNWMSGEWSATKPMTKGRSGPGCFSTGKNGGVLVFGGYNGVNLLSVEQYHPETGAWSQEPDMPPGFGLSSHITPLNLGDGVDLALFWRSNRVYRHDAETRQWSLLAGVQLPNTFDGYNRHVGHDKAFLVPDDFVPSCN